MNLNDEFIISPLVNISKTDEYFIIEFNEELYYVNEITVDILELLKEKYVSIIQIIESISKMYNTSKENCEEDIKEIFEQLTYNKIIKRKE